MIEQLWNFKIYILMLVTFLKMLYKEPIWLLFLFGIPFISAYFLLDINRFKKIIIHSVAFLFLSIGFCLIITHILRLWFIPQYYLFGFLDNIRYFILLFSIIFIYYNLYSECKDYRKRK